MAAQDRAKAEMDRINAEKEKEKQSENAAAANQDAARRSKKRTLFTGVEAEEGPLSEEEDSTSKAS